MTRARSCSRKPISRTRWFAPLTIPDLDKLIAPDYERFDFGGMGEFDVYLLAKQYGGDDAPKNYYPHWRGGYYFAAHAKAAPKDQIAMLYFSRWDSPESARAFAKLYGDYVPKRYKKVELGRGMSRRTNRARLQSHGSDDGAGKSRHGNPGQRSAHSGGLRRCA